MSRVVDDLRRNRLTPDVATPFLQRLTSIGSYIMETFGVGPDKGYDFKTIDVPSDGKQKEDILVFGYSIELLDVSLYLRSSKIVLPKRS